MPSPGECDAKHLGHGKCSGKFHLQAVGRGINLLCSQPLKLRIIDGLFRSLHSEYERQNWYTLSLEDKVEHPSVAKMIHSIINPPPTGLDPEYVVRKSQFLTPRLVDYQRLNAAIALQLADTNESMTCGREGVPFHP